MRDTETIAREFKTGMRSLLDMAGLACTHYETSSPIVSDWADDLYRRLCSPVDLTSIDYREIQCLAQLYDSDGRDPKDGWEQPNYAANRVYKLLSRLGRDTTGMAGF